MVRRDPTRDKIEALVLERQCFSLCICRADVGKAALCSFAFDHVEHFLSDVRRPNAGNMGRKSVGDMAAASGDVKNAPAFLRGGERNQPFQAFTDRVWFAGEVVGCGFAELLLDEGFAHGCSRSVPVNRNT